MALTAKRRSELRAEAHKLNPVVIIGDKGLTDEVLAEIDRSLKAHELIKVRATGGDRDAREIWFEKICGSLGAEEVQEIGKILVVYREKPKAEKARGTKPSTRTSRPRSRTPSPPPESSPRRRRPRSSR
jgi:RNA-binding protein